MAKKKTSARRTAEFLVLMDEYGFVPTGDIIYDDSVIYRREWREEINIGSRGLREKTLRLDVLEAYGVPMVRIFREGRLVSHRDYSCPKHAIKSLRSIVTIAGFEF